jgi:hypothetical protein|tara:strand:+ start:2066 stop:2587 length:522 start_codon:yes stop_codon:yes gene_type:complete
MGQVVDLFLVYQFIKRLSTPFENTKAYELGLIDDKGKRLKKASTRDEKNAMTYYDRLIFNLKRLIAKAGIQSRFVTFAAALFLLKEEQSNVKRKEEVTEKELMLFKEQNMSTIKDLVELTEEAPANAVGTGNIAGAGPGEDPPISMRVLKRHRNKNKQQANTVGRKEFHQMRR